MALVRDITQVNAQSKTRHAELRLTQYSVFDLGYQDRIFQLNTFGSKTREHPDKVSQSLQFDRDSARKLMKALSEAFPDLER